MLSHLFSTVGCKTRLNRRHPEDQSRTCMSCVNSRPFAEATGPEAMRRRAAGGPPGRLARAAASGRAGRTRGSVPWISRSCRRCHLECKRVGCRIFFTYYCSFLAQAGETPATAGESARTGGSPQRRWGAGSAARAPPFIRGSLAFRPRACRAPPGHGPPSLRLFFLFSSSNAHLLVLTRLSGSS